MPRQNPALLPSAANLLAAAGAVRSAIALGSMESLKAALTASADGFEHASAAIAVLERRLRDLGEANVDLSGRSAPMVVSGDRIRGGIPVQGILPNVVGQSLDLTFASQVAHVTSMDHGTGGYLELDLDGLGVTVNAHGGTITLTGTISLSTPLTVPMGGTGTATGSITGTGDLTFTAGGSNKTVALVSSGTGRVVAKPGTDSTTAIQLQNAAGTVIVDVDTTNSILAVGTVTPYAGTNPAKFQVHNGTDQNLLFRPKIGLANGVALHSIDDAYSVSKGLELIASAIYLNTAAPSIALAGVPVYANNAAAVTGGLAAGALYRTGADPDPVMIVH